MATGPLASQNSSGSRSRYLVMTVAVGPNLPIHRMLDGAPSDQLIGYRDGGMYGELGVMLIQRSSVFIDFGLATTFVPSGPKQRRLFEDGVLLSLGSDYVIAENNRTIIEQESHYEIRAGLGYTLRLGALKLDLRGGATYGGFTHGNGSLRLKQLGVSDQFAVGYTVSEATATYIGYYGGLQFRRSIKGPFGWMATVGVDGGKSPYAYTAFRQNLLRGGPEVNTNILNNGVYARAKVGVGVYVSTFGTVGRGNRPPGGDSSGRGRRTVALELPDADKRSFRRRGLDAPGSGDPVDQQARERYLQRKDPSSWPDPVKREARQRRRNESAGAHRARLEPNNRKSDPD